MYMKKFIRLSDNAVVTEMDLDPLCTTPSPNFRPNESEYVPVVDTPAPEYDIYSQKVVELEPTQTGSTWSQQWAVVELEGGELAAAQAQKVQDEADAKAQTQKNLENALELHIDNIAQSFTWKNITSAIAAAGTVNTFQANAVILKDFWEACWVKAHEIQDGVLAGASVPTIEEFIELMPKIEEFIS